MSKFIFLVFLAMPAIVHADGVIKGGSEALIIESSPMVNTCFSGPPADYFYSTMTAKEEVNSRDSSITSKGGSESGQLRCVKYPGRNTDCCFYVEKKTGNIR